MWISVDQAVTKSTVDTLLNFDNLRCQNTMADSKPAPRKTPRKLSDYGHPAPASTSRSLFASPFGLGKAVWGSLDHEGYTMSNQSSFYGNFILEVASNIHNDQKSTMAGLKQLTGKHDRMDAISYNYVGYWGINQARNFNVMYSRANNGRGNISHRETLVLDDNWDTFNEARAYANGGSDVRARYVAFPLPHKPEKHIWIDMNWPLRSIYLPISHKAQPGEQNLATYAQINFRHANGQIAVRKFKEDGTATEWYNFVGDNKLGLYRPGYVMRVNLEYLFNALVLPDSSRAESPLVALELHNWDAVNYRWGHSGTGVRERRVRDVGKSAADYFSANGGVDLTYEELPANFLKGLLQVRARIQPQCTFFAFDMQVVQARSLCDLMNRFERQDIVIHALSSSQVYASNAPACNMFHSLLLCSLLLKFCQSASLVLVHMIHITQSSIRHVRAFHIPSLAETCNTFLWAGQCATFLFNQVPINL